MDVGDEVLPEEVSVGHETAREKCTDRNLMWEFIQKKMGHFSDPLGSGPIWPTPQGIRKMPKKYLNQMLLMCN